MPKFIIEATADAVIREFWQVEAATAEDAVDQFNGDEPGALLWDEVIGEETGRAVSQVHGPGDLAGTVALHNAQQAAPAMLAALQDLLPLLREDIFTDAPECADTVAAVDNLASKLGQIIAAATGTLTDGER